jgi:hypothetical protein
VGEDWKAPIVFNPERGITLSSSVSAGVNDKMVRTMVLSPNKNYIAVSLGTDIVVYQIKK